MNQMKRFVLYLYVIFTDFCICGIICCGTNVQREILQRETATSFFLLLFYRATLGHNHIALARRPAPLTFFLDSEYLEKNNYFPILSDMKICCNKIMKNQTLSIMIKSQEKLNRKDFFALIKEQILY